MVASVPSEEKAIQVEDIDEVAPTLGRNLSQLFHSKLVYQTFMEHLLHLRYRPQSKDENMNKISCRPPGKTAALALTHTTLPTALWHPDVIPAVSSTSGSWNCLVVSSVRL